MVLFDAIKFKKLFAEVKEQDEHADSKQLGVSMATTGKVEELLTKSYQELMDALKSLTVRVEDIGKISEHLQRMDRGLKVTAKLPCPRRMW